MRPLWGPGAWGRSEQLQWVKCSYQAEPPSAPQSESFTPTEPSGSVSAEELDLIPGEADHEGMRLINLEFHGVGFWSHPVDVLSPPISFNQHHPFGSDRLFFTPPGSGDRRLRVGRGEVCLWHVPRPDHVLAQRRDWAEQRNIGAGLGRVWRCSAPDGCASGGCKSEKLMGQ